MLVLLLLPGNTYAYEVLYAEQFYRLYHTNFYTYPTDFNENIWYLQRAMRSDFANPLNALARIENTDQWERYRYLFYMQVNLELVKQYRLLAGEYDKRTAYFYNSPWKEQILESLVIAESYYHTALAYWEEALGWSAKAWSLHRLEIERLEQWADLNYRIEHYELDYGEIIGMDLERLNGVRTALLNFDESTY
ncbi:MAG: hypothetical protein JW852_11570 [Spirochaetales bacterium]|nr:hypothetical protein [Spirochaetales bacterium]